MKQPDKPVIVPNAVSLGGILWTGVLVVYFLAALAVYTQWGRLEAVRAELARPVETLVGNADFSTTVPAGWNCYQTGTNVVAFYKGEPRTAPMILVTARRDPANAYRALDLNPALAVRQISALLETVLKNREKAFSLEVVDVDLVNVKPGTPATKAFFILSYERGRAYCFYRGDIRYFVLGLWPNEDADARTEVCSRIDHIFERFEFPETVERITRPVVNSAEQPVGEHTRILKLVAREKALWKLYAGRVATEPEAALMPAIEHFRKAVELLSSLREERQLLDADDYKLYDAFLKRRAALVSEWFVLLEKYRAMGDRNAARGQAEFILRRATLEEEALDRRRAGACLAELDAEGGNG